MTVSEIHNEAHISACGNYRYLLTREFGGESTCLFVMLNPSSADSEVDDPTIRRCISFAKREGFGRMEVVNLYAFRTADPSALFAAEDPAGVENDCEIRHAIDRSNAIVLAWGNHATPERAVAVQRIVANSGKPTVSFGVTKQGSPRHPLYLSSTTLLVEFSWAAAPA